MCSEKPQNTAQCNKNYLTASLALCTMTLLIGLNSMGNNTQNMVCWCNLSVKKEKDESFKYRSDSNNLIKCFSFVNPFCFALYNSFQIRSASSFGL